MFASRQNKAENSSQDFTMKSLYTRDMPSFLRYNEINLKFGTVTFSNDTITLHLLYMLLHF